MDIDSDESMSIDADEEILAAVGDMQVYYLDFFNLSLLFKANIATSTNDWLDSQAGYI